MEKRPLYSAVAEWLANYKKLSVKAATYDRLLISCKLMKRYSIADEAVPACNRTHSFWRCHPDLNRRMKVLQTFIPQHLEDCSDVYIQHIVVSILETRSVLTQNSCHIFFCYSRKKQ